MSAVASLRLPLLYVVPRFLDPGTCRRIQAAMDRGTAEPAEVFDTGMGVNPDVRRATSIDVDPATLGLVESTLDAARAAVAAHFRLSLAGREGPGFLRYGPGGFYRRHRDRASDADWPAAARRVISLVVFLNSSLARPAAAECSGGALLILPDPDEAARSTATTIVPCQGSLVAFHATTLHEVRPVTRGIRDVIVDWFYE